MCGIAGILNLEKTSLVSSEIIRKMTDVIWHRGPDDEGFYVKGPLGMGMRRLSIIDLEGGHQPIHNENKKIWIVFNGEIYNYIELREDLEKAGHTFSTNTDTEVIVHQYEEDGEDCVNKFNGMFSFCIWDEKKQKLFLARDRIGIKPLYYTMDQNRFIFGSEVKSILQVPGVKSEIDTQALYEYLTFRFVPAPESMFKGVKKLLPGHTLTVENGQVRMSRYWDVPLGAKLEGLTEEEHIERFDNLFSDSVKKRLMSNVPLGVLLSGGLDSSAVVAMMTEMGISNIKTFSVGFKEGGMYSELHYARMVAQHFSTDHHEVVIDHKDFVDLLPHFIRFMDEPVADLASIPLFYVAQLARKNVTVVLSGEGSDEILAGYPGFQRTMKNLDIMTKYQSFSPKRKRFLQKFFRIFPENLRKKLNLLGLPLKQYGRKRLSHMTDVFSDTEKKIILDAAFSAQRDSKDLLADLYDSVVDKDPLDQILYVYFNLWLPGDLLIKADRMTMANSIELRVPFLDHRLVELAFSLPSRMKIRRNKKGKYGGKYLLRRIMENRLPRQILQRKKLGFPVPAYRWLEKELRDFCHDTLLSSQSSILEYFIKEKVESLVFKAESGCLASQHKVWSLIILEFWLKKQR